jgi:hypothetical protein
MGLEAPPSNPNGDPDRDGLSNFEEMQLWRNPEIAENLPRIPGRAELERAAEARETERQAQIEQDLWEHREMIQKANATMEKARVKDQVYSQNLFS